MEKIVGDGGVFRTLLTDLSKAFDCIPHDLIISKLEVYGFDIDALKPIHGYLANRKQCYISTSLFFKSERKHLSNEEKCFLFHFKSFFRSREDQMLELYIFKFYGVIKYLSIKQEIHFTE